MQTVAEIELQDAIRNYDYKDTEEYDTGTLRVRINPDGIIDFAFSYGFDRWANSALVSYVIQDLIEGPVGRMCNNAQPLGDLN